MSQADSRERHGRLEGRWGDLIWSFILMKRSAGHQYGRNCVYACERLCAFLGDGDMDEESFAEWVAPREGEKPKTRSDRILLWNAVARFAQRNGVEADAFDVAAPTGYDFVPHIYTAEDVESIFAAADAGLGLRESGYDRDAMMPVLLRLLYSTGMRFCEAARLRWGDVDGRRVLIAKGKNGKPRLVMLSGSMAEVMEAYRARRVGGGDGLVFCGKAGEPLRNSTVRKWHNRLLDACGIRNEDGTYPRLHDYRHAFALNALARMDAAGGDIYVTLPLLSRYMGHCGPKETELYLRLTDEGRARILGLMESYAPGIVPELKGL